ncbi:MAG: TonB-dependent receptor [Gemmatimonadales bacterium]
MGQAPVSIIIGIISMLLVSGSRLQAQGRPGDQPGHRETLVIETSRRLHGQVTDSATGAVIAGAAVSVPEAARNTPTDAVGRFNLSGLAPGVVTLDVRAIGYAAVVQPIDLTSDDAEVMVALARRAFQLDSLVVQADDAGEQFLGAQQATATMNAGEIAAGRGQTLGETIRELPGVAIIQYGPSIAKPVVRGLHSQRLVVMNGAVPQEGQQWGAEHAPEIDAFAANEIEIIRGPGAVLYGSNALGGVLRVLPRPLPGSGKIGGEIAANGFSNNRQAAGSLLLEGAELHLPIVGQLGWRAQLSGRLAGDASSPDYYLANTGFRELNYSGAIGVRRGWGDSEISFSHFGSDLGLYLGAHVGNIEDLERAMATPYISPEFSYDILRPKQEVRHNLFAWRTNLTLPGTGRFEVAYGYQHNERNEFDSRGFFASTQRPAFGLRLATHSADVRFHHAPVGRLAGTFGISGMRQGNVSPGRSFLIPQYRLYGTGVYGLEQLTLGRLRVTGGLRYEYRWQHAYQYGAPVIISPDQIRSYSGGSGSLGLTARIATGWSLAATAGRAWRPPNVNELYSQGVHHGTAQYEIGDTSLISERGFNLDATLRHVGRRVLLEVTGYRNRIADYIYLRPREPVQTVRGAYPAYTYAQTDAQLLGAELTAQMTPASWLTLYASGNLVRGTDRQTGAPLYDMPADRLAASARLYGGSRSWVKDPYVEVGATLVRRQDRVPPATVYRLPTAGYALANLEVGARAVRILGQTFEPSLAVRNLFDVRYRDYLSRYRLFVDEPGRDIALRVTVPFGDTPHRPTQGFAGGTQPDPEE